MTLLTTVSRAAPAVKIDHLRWGYDFFVTDGFKFSPRLTLNIGLRYELHPNWTEANGLLSSFDLDRGKIVVPNGSLSRVSPLLPRGFVGVVETRDAVYPGDTLIKTDRNNFTAKISDFCCCPFLILIHSSPGRGFDFLPISHPTG